MKAATRRGPGEQQSQDDVAEADAQGGDSGHLPEPAPSDGPVRLSVNLGTGAAAALRELMSRKDITATEAIRRALSVWKFIEDERAQGRSIALLEGRGKDQVVREVVFHD